jgi:DNA-binding NtrC family response regulator
MASSATIQSVKRQTKPFSPIEAQIQRAIARIAESDCPVLIVGEHGVGKRSIAAQIHAQSHRSRSIIRRFTAPMPMLRLSYRPFPPGERSIWRRSGI